MSLIRSILLGSVLLAGSSNLAFASDFKTLVQERAEAGNVTAMPDAIPYSFLVSVDVINDDKEDPSKSFNGQYRFNPEAAPGDRVTLIGLEWDDLPKDMRKDLEETNLEQSSGVFADEFWCNAEQETFDILASDDVTVISETETEAVLSLGPRGIAHFLDNDDEGERSMPKKIRKRMLSEVTVSKPDLQIQKSRIWLSEPTTVKIIAKMKTMDFAMGCSLTPDGLPYYSENNASVSGKAMGKEFGATIKMTITDLQPN